MLFNSLTFAVFLPLVFIAYWLIPAKYFRWQNAFLIVVSYFFYGWWDWRFLSLIFFSSSVDYLLGLGMGRWNNQAIRKRLLWTSLFVNLSLLGVFKYFGFFVDSVVTVITAMGFSANERTLEIILPVGISFYTFQTLSYTIDLYRKKIPVCKDPVAFFAFVSFFPQLVIGPIERAYRMLPQYAKPRTFDVIKAKDGLRQMLWGLFKKIVVGDTLYQLNQPFFENPGGQEGLVLLITLFLFAFQVYADFSGYSDMAIGMARLFGIHLERNFAYPFFSRDFIEYWQRWHISLSTWFRDYIFIPLGGSKVSHPRLVMNALITFGISGLWHGASFNMILWGLICGVWYAVTRFTGLYKKGRILSDPYPEFTPIQVGQMILTFLMFALPLVLVRYNNWEDATNFYSSLFTNDFLGFSKSILIGLLWVTLMMGVEWWQRKKEHGLAIEHLPLTGRWVFYGLVFNAILFFGVFEQKVFFYFQF